MFKAAILAVLCMASPALSQVTIAENGIQIAAPMQGFSLYDSDEFYKARYWIHDSIPLFSITLMNKQDPENTYSGMVWEKRAWDPLVSQHADITVYHEAEGWMIAHGEISGNSFYQRSIIKNNCPVIATLIIEFPEEARALANIVSARLARSLTIAPSLLCP